MAPEQKKNIEDTNTTNDAVVGKAENKVIDVPAPAGADATLTSTDGNSATFQEVFNFKFT